MSSKNFHVTKSDVVGIELKGLVYVCFLKESFATAPSTGDSIFIDGKKISVVQAPFSNGNYINVPVRVCDFMNFL